MTKLFCREMESDVCALLVENSTEYRGSFLPTMRKSMGDEALVIVAKLKLELDERDEDVVVATDVLDVSVLCPASSCSSAFWTKMLTKNGVHSLR